MSDGKYLLQTEGEERMNPLLQMFFSLSIMIVILTKKSCLWIRSDLTIHCTWESYQVFQPVKENCIFMTSKRYFFSFWLFQDRYEKFSLRAWLKSRHSQAHTFIKKKHHIYKQSNKMTWADLCPSFKIVFFIPVNN